MTLARSRLRHYYSPMLPENASTLLIAAGLIVALYLMLRRRAGGAATDRTPDLGPSVPHSSFRIQNSTPPDLLRWQVEMHDTARELKGQLDCKLAALQALVALARCEADRLEAGLRRAEKFDVPAAFTAAASGPVDTLAAIESLADAAALADPTALAKAASKFSAVAEENLGGHMDADIFADNRRTIDLARLADQGLSPAEISRRLSLPLGEVELLLSLRPA